MKEIIVIALITLAASIGAGAGLSFGGDGVPQRTSPSSSNSISLENVTAYSPTYGNYVQFCLGNYGSDTYIAHFYWTDVRMWQNSSGYLIDFSLRNSNTVVRSPGWTCYRYYAAVGRVEHTGSLTLIFASGEKVTSSLVISK